MTELVAVSQPPPAPAVRIKRIAVEKLFGSFDHDVGLKADARVTIILGANGIGKTQLLECVAALFGGRLERLVGVPFGTLVVDLDDGSTLRVEQRSVELPPQTNEELQAFRRGRRKHRVRRSLTIQLLRSGIPVSEPWEPRRSERKRIEHADLPNWVVPVEFGHWWDEQGERFLTAREMRVLHGLEDSPFEEVPEWFQGVLQRTSVRLIETQRLLRTHRRRRHRYLGDSRFLAEDRPGTSVQFAVRDLIDDLTEKMRSWRQRYHRQATVLDQSYVERFLRYEASPESTADTLQDRLDHIAARRARLEQLSLLDAETRAGAAARGTRVADEKRLALSLFASDMDQKLSVLEPFAGQLERLIQTVNKKLGNTGKEIITDFSGGLVVQTRGGAKLDLEHLSSGEQHELVLLYDLLFRVGKRSLVLIDEPELSLHPAWQQEFVDDLMSIAQANEFDVILATHSPYIVGGRVSLCVSLNAPTP